jgi:hypothetical protein
MLNSKWYFIFAVWWLIWSVGCAVEPMPLPTPFVLPTKRAAALPTETARVPSPTHTARVPPASATPQPTFEPTRTFTAVPFTPTRARPTLPPPSPTAQSIPLPTTLPRPLIWDPRLDELNIQYIPVQVQPGERYWRLTHAEFWAESENQGKHHIYVNVLDENGSRLLGETITIEWLDGSHEIVTEDKPAPEYAANFPMDINHYPPWHSLGAYSARVNGLPSDIVRGMGRPPPKSRPVVYLLTFQRTIKE